VKTYRSHKLVRAARVIGTAAMSGQAVWLLDDGTCRIASERLQERVPVEFTPGDGYLVEYADGFQSWSPARAFEEGYSEVPVTDAPEWFRTPELG
jgi:hypothetical protein